MDELEFKNMLRIVEATKLPRVAKDKLIDEFTESGVTEVVLREAIKTEADYRCASSVFGPAQPSALSGTRTQVGGTLRVSFDNAPTNMKVTEVRSDNPDVGIDVDAGYAMATP